MTIDNEHNEHEARNVYANNASVSDGSLMTWYSACSQRTAQVLFASG